MHKIGNVCAQITNMDLTFRPIRKKSAYGLMSEIEATAGKKLNAKAKSIYGFQ